MVVGIWRAGGRKGGDFWRLDVRCGMGVNLRFKVRGLGGEGEGGSGSGEVALSGTSA